HRISAFSRPCHNSVESGSYVVVKRGAFPKMPPTAQGRRFRGKDASVNDCTPAASSLAMPSLSLLPVELLGRLCVPILETVRLIRQFRNSDLTPRAAYDFEQRLFAL